MTCATSDKGAWQKRARRTSSGGYGCALAFDEVPCVRPYLTISWSAWSNMEPFFAFSFATEAHCLWARNLLPIEQCVGFASMTCPYASARDAIESQNSRSRNTQNLVRAYEFAGRSKNVIAGLNMQPRERLSCEPKNCAPFRESHYALYWVEYLKRQTTCRSHLLQPARASHVLSTTRSVRSSG